jgi:ATP-dependent Clp protease ATP-binding subunit ClpC
MFGNLSPNGLAALSIASQESQQLNHYYLGAEHIFIGLCKADAPVVVKACKDCNFDPVYWRRQVRGVVGTGGDPVWGKQLIVTPRSHRVLKLAQRVSQHYRADKVEPAHLFLALLLEGQGIPVRQLRREGFPVETLEDALAKSLENQASIQRENPLARETPTLQKFGWDLTLEAQQGKLPPLVGRQTELKRVVQILLRKTKSNPMIVGEAGVGKSALVQGVAQYLRNPQALEELRAKRVIAVNLTALVAGTRYRGDFEDRLERILAEARAHPEVILFFDEIHTVMGAGAAMGTLDAANILKAPLANGEIRCIGATTLGEYRAHIEPDAALERRFEVVHLEEPTAAQTLEILQGLRASFEEHHQVEITDDALAMAVQLGGRYLTDRNFPDKAIDLIDMAATQVRLSTLHPSPATSDVPSRLRVDKIAVARVVSQKVGDAVPEGELDEADADKALQLEERLRQRIVGQDEAVAMVARVMRSHLAGLRDPQRPIAVLLFVGPTGVGKTELARVLAAEWFGSEKKLLRFDMSEYAEAHTVSRLLGSPPGYVGHEEGGQLSRAVRTHPHAVMLLDEVEKAHPEVLKVFLQIFDAGRVTDNKGRVINCANLVIILTSNLGSSDLGKPVLGFHGQGEPPQDWQDASRKIKAAVKAAFPPEFRNRLDAEIVFQSLTDDGVLHRILSLMLTEVQAFLTAQRLKLEVAPEVQDLLLKEGVRKEFGARELRRTVNRILRDPLAERLLGGEFRPGDRVRVTLDPGGMVTFNKVPGVTG